MKHIAIDNQQVITEYLNWCENVKRLSGETIATYFSALKALRIYLDQNKLAIVSLSTEDMREYFILLNKRKNLAKISVNDYRSVLKTFFKYLIDQNIIVSNPMAKVGPQKAKKPKHDALNIKQLEHLIKKIDDAGTFLFRDTVMFELFWNSGFRTSELSRLEESHLNIVKVTVKEKNEEGEEIGQKVYKVYEIRIVQGKGSKDRFVTVGDTTTLLLKKFLHAKKILYPATEYVFPSKRGSKLNRRQIYGIISNFLELSQTKKKGAHVLRHTYATMLLNNGVSILKVKELLGHSRVVTTTIYAKPSQELMAAEFNKAHPKGDKKLAKKNKPTIGVITNYKFEA